MPPLGYIHPVFLIEARVTNPKDYPAALLWGKVTYHLHEGHEAQKSKKWSITQWVNPFSPLAVAFSPNCSIDQFWVWAVFENTWERIVEKNIDWRSSYDEANYVRSWYRASQLRRNQT